MEDRNRKRRRLPREHEVAPARKPQSSRASASDSSASSESDDVPFDIDAVGSDLRDRALQHCTSGAPVYLSAVLQRVTGHILSAAAQASGQRPGDRRIRPEDIGRALREVRCALPAFGSAVQRYCLPGLAWDNALQTLVADIAARAQHLTQLRGCCLSVEGIPRSGKTTLATAIASRLGTAIREERTTPVPSALQALFALDPRRHATAYHMYRLLCASADLERAMQGIAHALATRPSALAPTTSPPLQAQAEAPRSADEDVPLVALTDTCVLTELARASVAHFTRGFIAMRERQAIREGLACASRNLCALLAEQSAAAVPQGAAEMPLGSPSASTATSARAVLLVIDADPRACHARMLEHSRTGAAAPYTLQYLVALDRALFDALMALLLVPDALPSLAGAIPVVIPAVDTEHGDRCLEHIRRSLADCPQPLEYIGVTRSPPKDMLCISNTSDARAAYDSDVLRGVLRANVAIRLQLFALEESEHFFVRRIVLHWLGKRTRVHVYCLPDDETHDPTGVLQVL